MARWMCNYCGTIYDEAEGDPDHGIPPGTPFEAIDDNWLCPDCAQPKSSYAPYD